MLRACKCVCALRMHAMFFVTTRAGLLLPTLEASSHRRKARSSRSERKCALRFVHVCMFACVSVCVCMCLRLDVCIVIVRAQLAAEPVQNSRIHAHGAHSVELSRRAETEDRHQQQRRPRRCRRRFVGLALSLFVVVVRRGIRIARIASSVRLCSQHHRNGRSRRQPQQ